MKKKKKLTQKYWMLFVFYYLCFFSSQFSHSLYRFVNCTIHLYLLLEAVLLQSLSLFKHPLYPDCFWQYLIDLIAPRRKVLLCYKVSSPFYLFIYFVLASFAFIFHRPISSSNDATLIFRVAALWNNLLQPLWQKKHFLMHDLELIN